MGNARFSAIAIGFFFGFVLPFGILMLTSQLLVPADGDEPPRLLAIYNLLWMLIAIGGPVGAGYLAAKIATVQPLLHGCLVGTLGAVFLAAMTTPAIAGFWSAFVFVPGGIAGGWLWKSRHAKSAP